MLHSLLNVLLKLHILQHRHQESLYQVGKKKKKSRLIQLGVNSASVDNSDMSLQGNPIPNRK